MKQMNFKMPPSDLVRLYLVAPHQIEPVPDKAVLGRFDKSLRSVGATGSIAIRARMITAIASTKFKTIGGLPVSLVGLHGKDDLLVLGPTWAIERLATGNSPPTQGTVSGRRDRILEAERLIKVELDCLSHLCAILPRAKHLPPRAKDKDVSRHEAAREFLGAMFRASIDKVLKYFEENDADEFVDAMSKEARKVTAALDTQLDSNTDNHPVWWEAWEEGQSSLPESFCITETGRHVTTYPIAGTEPEKLRKPRPLTNDVQSSLVLALQ